jgi:hypothetical protein
LATPLKAAPEGALIALQVGVDARMVVGHPKRIRAGQHAAVVVRIQDEGATKFAYTRCR